MKPRAIFFILSALLATLPLQGGASEGPSVRALLLQEKTSALLEVKGAYRVVDTKSGKILSSGLNGKRFVVHSTGEGVRWGEEYSSFELEIVPAHAETTIFLDGMQYRGSLTISQTENLHFNVVNTLPIEQFLRSTLALDAPEGVSPEALSAFVIARRTEVYHKMVEQKTSNWDLVAHQMHYFGEGVTSQNKGVDAAIERTRFMILESTRELGFGNELKLNQTEVQELAERGLDAKQILSSLLPYAKMGITVDEKSLASKTGF